ncbi:MAG: hypothetical protein G01um101417_424 [Parcubacteria group bacterium Gr01-1014_17]|nr:MAG: hypothetical protein G01um101417_424 [Parcubacteria group bacterium Gr01-1014_17]
MKGVILTVWDFFLVVFVYAIASLWLFLLTSGGWSGIGVMVYGVVVFGSILLVLFVISIVRAVRKHKLLNISIWSMLVLLVVQLLALLFNRGDCGDGPGSYFFFKKALFGLHSVCRGWRDDIYEYSTGMWGVFMLAYLVVFIATVFFFTKHFSDIQTQSCTKSWIKMVLRSIGILFIIGSLVFWLRV